MFMLLAAIATLAMPTSTDPPALTPTTTAVTSWPTPTMSLDRDVVHGRPASEPTVVHSETDGQYLYVRFDVTQKEPITATQHNNDVGQGSDDGVWVDLWPTGPNGFFYQFQATPNGTHYEQSSENTGFSPQWEAAGETTPTGYVVTMKIPLKVIHGAHKGTWLIQFVRYTHATGEEDVWSYDSSQTNPDDVVRAGTTQMALAAGVAPPRPSARAALYALGLATTPAYGGATSRVGADISLPITATSSFFATFHPDYSNVELDQQSISPTVYQRIFSEVRPFFTQAANFYSSFNCDVCSGYHTILYTPDIPTPAQGYAVEGRQGNFGFASFDAIGDQRTDIANALDYTSPNQAWNSSYVRVQANLPGLTDVAQEFGTSWWDRKFTSLYLNVGNETGSDVADPDQAKFIDAGGGYGDQHFALYGALRNYGADFTPYDGINPHPGIAGYALYSAYIWNPKKDSGSKIAAIGIDGFLDRYQGPQYGQSQSDNAATFDILTKSSWDLQLYTGSDYWRFGEVLTPISQNAGFQLTWHSGLQTDNPGNFPNHGSSATPVSIAYFTGAYGDQGRLDTWYRNITMRAGSRGTFSVAIDSTSQWFYGRQPDNIQWFESVSYTYQISRDSSISIGDRKIIGYPPQPNGGGNCEGACSNVSVAYHLRWKKYELYAAYGDPNNLSTLPQVLFKIIFYAGATKGT